MMADKPSCVAKNSRVLYFFVNFVVWIFGLILIAVGGFILQNLSAFAFVYVQNESELLIGCWVLIGLGCLVFLAGFNGVWACMKESHIGMKIYFAVMICIVIAELATGILAFVGREQVKENTRNTMKNQVKNEFGKGGIVDDGYNNIQQKQRCCGVDGPSDWNDSYFSRLVENSGVAVPPSCCIPKNKTGCNLGTPGQPDKPQLVHEKGCSEAVVTFQIGNINTLGMIALIMVALESVSLLLVCCVISTRPELDLEKPDQSESSVTSEDEKL
ncbi:tetraspanin-7-like [Asterias amurensis]|uniref:tetraspanin-7-like n=1 Tax=Asterias amurensis TaxID=7602 RepID=UPI003AB513CD